MDLMSSCQHHTSYQVPQYWSVFSKFLTLVYGKNSQVCAKWQWNARDCVTGLHDHRSQKRNSVTSWVHFSHFALTHVCSFLSHTYRIEMAPHPQWSSTPATIWDACYHIEAETNGRHFPGNIFKCILFNKNVLISIIISLKFVPKVAIDNKPALVQIMAWRLTGNKSLSEPMMAKFTDTYMHHRVSMS